MRSARWLRCAVGGSSTVAASVAGESAAAAAAAPPPPPPPPPAASNTAAAPQPEAAAGSSGADSAATKKKQQTASPPAAAAAAVTRVFNVLTFQPWQAHTVQGGSSQLLPARVLLHGEALGPRPLLILDHSLPSSVSASDMQQRAARYEPMLSSLSWAHGAVYVPLSVSPREKQTMARSCDTVSAVMDALDVRWSHFLTYSYGTMVAARMAASATHPHRIGTILALDTPLVTEALLRAMQTRADLAKAELDVNVPAAELSFTKEELLENLEGPLPCCADADKELFETYLFHPDSIFEEGGLIRNEERYVPVRDLAAIRHPMQWLLPSTQPVTDVPTHKEFFNVRRPAVIKSATKHEDLFKPAAATEVADVVRAWMHRFEPDVLLQRRYEQAAKEMAQLMGSTPSTAAGAAAAAAGSGDAKPKKKKKKDKG